MGDEAIYPTQRCLEKPFQVTEFMRPNQDHDEPDYEDNYVYMFGSKSYDDHNLQLVLFKNTSLNQQDGFVMFLGNIK